MTSSLLFSQATFQSQSPHIDKGLMGSFLQNRSAVSKSYAERSADTRASFLNTFERIFKDPKQNHQTQGVHRAKTFLSSAYNPGAKFDGNSVPADTVHETGIPATTKERTENPENGESAVPHALDLAAIMSIIEKLALYDSAGEESNADKMDGTTGTAGDLAELKKLFDRLEQIDLVRASKVKADLYRLHQIFINAQTDGASFHNETNSTEGLGDSRSTEIAELNQLMNRIAINQENHGGSSWVYVEGSDPDEKPSDKFVEMNRVTKGLQNSPGQPETLQSSENTQFASRSAIEEKPDAIKVAMETRLVEVEASEHTKESNPFETVRTETIGPKEGAVTPEKSSAHIQANSLNRVPPTIYSGKHLGDELAAQNVSNTESSPVLKNTNDAQASKVLETGQRNGGEPAQNYLVQDESSPVSKMIHDAQLAKENHIKMEAAVGDESNGKVSKVEIGSMDTGLLSSQNQTTEKAFEVTSISRHPNADSANFRTQALDQIVRKAVIFVRNGQHEAKIDLKPEFLGHVRMQVTTENHQVTVKILTEFGFVKDMVENNIHQLKSDLQQQGLMVDKLEVAISNGTDEYRHPHEKSRQAKDRQRGTAQINPVSQEGEIPEQAMVTGLGDDGKMTVDYFA